MIEAEGPPREAQPTLGPNCCPPGVGPNMQQEHAMRRDAKGAARTQQRPIRPLPAIRRRGSAFSCTQGPTTRRGIAQADAAQLVFGLMRPVLHSRPFW